MSEHAPGAATSLEPVIGLEIHVQLGTRTKMFCGNAVEFGAEPNTHVCPVCLGLPGALPVINADAVRLAVRAGLGLNCAIHETSVFARKNYFYPDLPKGYQITQFDRPICTAGWLDAPTDGEAGQGGGTSHGDGETAGRRDGGTGSSGSGDTSALGADAGAVHPAEDSRNSAAIAREAASAGIDAPSRPPAVPPSAGEVAPGRVRIRRIHLEEDAGKSIHDRLPGRTAVDLNRAGTPLCEIVTEPDLRSPAQARAFLTRLKQILEYLEVSDCDMEKGSLRVDANVSVRPAGTEALGVKTEVKNMNSFSNVEHALAFEIRRQTAEIEAGRAITQETLLWDAGRGEARPMRSKEESHDYRYFPEPDLPPLVLEEGQVERERASLPELPDARLHRFVEAYGLPAYDAEVLTATRVLADYFERAAAAAGNPKAASNWVMGEVLGWANQHQTPIDALAVQPEHVGELIRLVADGTLSHNLARQVFEKSATTGRAPGEIVRAEGLAQVRDTSRLETWADEVVAAHPDAAARYRAGEAKLLGFFMGEVMKKSRGKADPKQATQALRDRLGRE